MPPSTQLQQYLQSNEEEPYYILKTNNPGFVWVPDGYDPDHFMPWVHPFTSMIAGPTGSWFHCVFLDETDSERCT
jgi:hypothetical protein